MRVEGWVLRHQAIASVSLHLPHKTLAAMDASHPTPPPSPWPYQHGPHIHAQAQGLHVKPIQLGLVMVFQL